MAKFEIFIGTNRQFYFRLKTNNGEKILGSEGYATKFACQNGITSVKTFAQDDQRYEKKILSNGKPYFVLKANNGQAIGQSEIYESASGRDNGIAFVKKEAPYAFVADLV
jgi:uncharacterized protein